MPITFPTSPSDGDTYDFGGYRWVYDATTGATRWVGTGFTPIPDPFADFTLTTYAGPTAITTRNIGVFNEIPFNFSGNTSTFATPPEAASGIGVGIASDSVATSGVVALYQNAQGQGSGVLLPTDLCAVTGASIMGTSLLDFDGPVASNTSLAVQLVDGTRRRASAQSIGGNGGGFGPGGPRVSGNQIMQGLSGLSVDGSDITNHANIARIEFRIPSGNGATGTAGNTVVLIIERDTIATTLTEVGNLNPNPPTGEVSNYYNYRWGVLDEPFVAPAAQ